MFEKWLEEFSSENTKKTYLQAMRKFANYIERVENKDVDSFVENYLDQLEDKEEFIEDVKGFISYMDKNLAPKTISLYVSSVKEFFEEKTKYKIEDTEWKAIRRRQIPTAKAVSKDKILDKKELRKVIAHLDSMGTSIILFLLSSGARSGEAVKLKVKDLDLEADPPRAELRREYTKNGVGRVVFMSDEARDSIKDWLRVRKGMRKATPEDKRKEEDSNTYDTETLWNCTPDLVRKKWNKALEKAGLDETDNQTNIERHVYHLHSLRKYFRTNIDLDRDIIETLLGHEGYLDSSYRRYREKDLAEEYKTAENSLKIYEVEPSKKEQFERALAMQGLSMDEAVEMFNEMGFKHSETGEAYNSSNLATEETEKIGKMMKVSRAKKIERENNIMEKVIEKNKERDMESLAREGLEKLKEINENNDLGNIDGVDELLDKIEKAES